MKQVVLLKTSCIIENKLYNKNNAFLKCISIMHKKKKILNTLEILCFISILFYTFIKLLIRVKVVRVKFVFHVIV